jgi:Fur family ferric uptake transcriptional regulator
MGFQFHGDGHMKGVSEAFSQFLKQKNLQITMQRQLIVDEFAKAKRHLSVEELYDLVKKREKSIGQVTVFRTLKLLTEANIARAVNFGDKTVRYELDFGTEHHDHLVCLQCGAVVEVYDPDLEKLQNKLCRKYGFSPNWHRLEVFGTCKKCN